MADLLIKAIPLPISRPIRIVGPDTPAGMPLESPEKAADALFSAGGTLPTPRDKSISTGFLEACDQIYQGIYNTMMDLYNNINNLYSQLQTGYLPDDWMPRTLDLSDRLTILGGGAVVIFLIWYFLWGRDR